MELTHLDEHGNICTRHAHAASSELLAFALVGSRAPGFHHDLASKLQGLMMAIDEIGEVSGDIPPAVMRAIDTAQDALREVLGLLNGNRTLTMPPVRTRISLADLLACAAERVYVNLRDTPTTASVEVPVPALTHALALVLDAAGGPGRGRTVEVTTVVSEGHATITIVASSDATENIGESLAIARFALLREQGDLQCAAEGSRLVVRLPVVA
ncbi:MAG: hypothetical protein H0T46_05690 [Deltaproteobacteria bacterium]|nr:hypothetical protein [Deltaproteobacteria bacterium]